MCDCLTVREKVLRWITLCCVTLAVACDRGETFSADRGRVLFQSCTPCHQPDGSGNRAVGAPAIAGQNHWYIETQLSKFRSGVRGSHFDDVTGMRMRPMARTLASDEDVEAVAAYVASLPPRPGDRVLTGGDPVRGKERYAVCATCHGQNAEGIEAQQKSPSLNRTNDWYTFNQLMKFKSGIRGSSPMDMGAFQMRPMAMTLPDEQAVKDVVAYITTLPMTND